MERMLSSMLACLVLFACGTGLKESPAKLDNMETSTKNPDILQAPYPQPLTSIGTKGNDNVNHPQTGHNAIIGFEQTIVCSCKKQPANRGFRGIGKCLMIDKTPGMCAKDPLSADGIVRLSKIEVYPQYLNEYREQAVEVGEISLRTEPGVLTMYAVSERENPCRITILETYASQEAYEKHIASPHFQRYKQETLHMVKSLVLSDQTPLNPASRINNIIQ